MGNVLSFLLPCLSKNKNIPKSNLTESQLQDSSINFNGTILESDFFCPLCGNQSHEIPEILKICSDNGKILLRCPKREIEYEDDLKKYFDKITLEIDKTCGNCPENNKKPGEMYCLKCGRFLCDMCLKDDKIKETKNIEKIAGNKSDNQNCLCLQRLTQEKQKENQEIHYHVDINDMSVLCPLHGLKTDIPCLDCEKNCCKECFDKYHKWHTKRDINSKEINDARIKIIIKDDKLFSMKQFYDMIKLSYESNQNNEAYKNNLVKVAKCINSEKERNKYDVDLAIYRIGQINKNINVGNVNNIDNLININNN